jgi:hypothetical protein
VKHPPLAAVVYIRGASFLAIVTFYEACAGITTGFLTHKIGCFPRRCESSNENTAAGDAALEQSATFQFKCTCRNCNELGTFLNNPSQSTWSLKAAEARRKYVEYSIKSYPCDLTCVTERKSSPQSVISSNNIASHQRRVEQRKKDLDVFNVLVYLNRK